MCKRASGDYRKRLLRAGKRPFEPVACSFTPKSVTFPLVIGRIMAPKDVHILTPGIYEHVTFHGKRDLADVVKNLEMGSFV